MEEECDGWYLERFLVEPVNRIAVYPGLFKRLLDATPEAPGDYLSTVSLLRSTELMIKVMTKVKLREDKYVYQDIFKANKRGIGCCAEGPPTFSAWTGSSRTPRLSTAINDWDNRRARSASSWKMPPNPSPNLLVPCVPLQDHQDSDGCSLCEDIGITRILEVKDDAEQELLPVYVLKDMQGHWRASFDCTASASRYTRRTAYWLKMLQNSPRTTSSLLSVPMDLDYF
ncbi:hypothetical protein BDZ89DRAFT_1142099 [Hymenopellis radicata]|nr:hypothetical protein BDZ89DRAFT_1142099 [Hymenopellis radicata]